LETLHKFHPFGLSLSKPLFLRGIPFDRVSGRTALCRVSIFAIPPGYGPDRVSCPGHKIVPKKKPSQRGARGRKKGGGRQFAIFLLIFGLGEMALNLVLSSLLSGFVQKSLWVVSVAFLLRGLGCFFYCGFIISPRPDAFHTVCV
jgi:hypothetical protein